MNRTRALCDFLSDLSMDQLSAADRLDVRYRLLDWLGCTVGALRLDNAAAARALLLAEGGAPRASAVGMAEKVSSQQAAFYHGFVSHALEYDDTNKIAITHPGAPVISAALAAAEAEGADLGQLTLGIAAGYEAMIRLGGALNPDHYNYWHTTGTCGAFAAAAACGHIMGLSGETLERAMGFAATMAAGLVCVFGTDAKLVTVGNAARNGLLAAALARQGLSAPQDAFASPRGYARAAGGKEDLSFMVPQPGDRLMLEDAYYKMHASCGHTQSALDALQSLLHTYALRAEEVESVRVLVYRKTYELCREYRSDTESQAKFSLPYCLSAMLRTGRCTLAEFTPEQLADEAARHWAQRITVEEDESFTAAYPALRKARVILTLRDGRQVEKQVDLPEGHPQPAFLEEKYRTLTAPVISPACAETLRDAVLTLGDETPAAELGRLIRQLRRI